MAGTKKGGNFSKDLANLSVPFGLILAQKSLEKYLQMKPKKETTKPKKETSKSKKETPKPKKSAKNIKKTIV
tara:strand:+ start:1034 stop:1249 length:216 start_codon:yes stop_codon:yes gene_type:complete